MAPQRGGKKKEVNSSRRGGAKILKETFKKTKKTVRNKNVKKSKSKKILNTSCDVLPIYGSSFNSVVLKTNVNTSSDSDNAVFPKRSRAKWKKPAILESSCEEFEEERHLTRSVSHGSPKRNTNISVSPTDCKTINRTATSPRRTSQAKAITSTVTSPRRIAQAKAITSTVTSPRRTFQHEVPTAASSTATTDSVAVIVCTATSTSVISTISTAISTSTSKVHQSSSESSDQIIEKDCAITLLSCSPYSSFSDTMSSASSKSKASTMSPAKSWNPGRKEFQKVFVSLERLALNSKYSASSLAKARDFPYIKPMPLRCKLKLKKKLNFSQNSDSMSEVDYDEGSLKDQQCVIAGMNRDDLRRHSQSISESSEHDQNCLDSYGNINNDSNSFISTAKDRASNLGVKRLSIPSNSESCDSINTLQTNIQREKRKSSKASKTIVSKKMKIECESHLVNQVQDSDLLLIGSSDGNLRSDSDTCLNSEIPHNSNERKLKMKTLLQEDGTLSDHGNNGSLSDVEHASKKSITKIENSAHIKCTEVTDEDSVEYFSSSDKSLSENSAQNSRKHKRHKYNPTDNNIDTVLQDQKDVSKKNSRKVSKIGIVFTEPTVNTDLCSNKQKSVEKSSLLNLSPQTSNKHKHHTHSHKSKSNHNIRKDSLNEEEHVHKQDSKKVDNSAKLVIKSAEGSSDICNRKRNSLDVDISHPQIHEKHKRHKHSRENKSDIHINKESLQEQKQISKQTSNDINDNTNVHKKFVEEGVSEVTNLKDKSLKVNISTNISKKHDRHKRHSHERSVRNSINKKSVNEQIHVSKQVATGATSKQVSESTEVARVDNMKVSFDSLLYLIKNEIAKNPEAIASITSLFKGTDIDDHVTATISPSQKLPTEDQEFMMIDQTKSQNQDTTKQSSDQITIPDKFHHSSTDFCTDSSPILPSKDSNISTNVTKTFQTSPFIDQTHPVKSKSANTKASIRCKNSEIKEDMTVSNILATSIRNNSYENTDSVSSIETIIADISKDLPNKPEPTIDLRNETVVEQFPMEFSKVASSLSPKIMHDSIPSVSSICKDIDSSVYDQTLSVQSSSRSATNSYTKEENNALRISNRGKNVSVSDTNEPKCHSQSLLNPSKNVVNEDHSSLSSLPTTGVSESDDCKRHDTPNETSLVSDGCDNFVSASFDSVDEMGKTNSDTIRGRNNDSVDKIVKTKSETIRDKSNDSVNKMDKTKSDTIRGKSNDSVDKIVKTKSDTVRDKSNDSVDKMVKTKSDTGGGRSNDSVDKMVKTKSDTSRGRSNDSVDKMGKTKSDTGGGRSNDSVDKMVKTKSDTSRGTSNDSVDKMGKTKSHNIKDGSNLQKRSKIETEKSPRRMRSSNRTSLSNSIAPETNEPQTILSSLNLFKNNLSLHINDGTDVPQNASTGCTKAKVINKDSCRDVGSKVVIKLSSEMSHHSKTPSACSFGTSAFQIESQISPNKIEKAIQLSDREKKCDSLIEATRSATQDAPANTEHNRKPPARIIRLNRSNFKAPDSNISTDSVVANTSPTSVKGNTFPESTKIDSVDNIRVRQLNMPPKASKRVVESSPKPTLNIHLSSAECVSTINKVTPNSQNISSTTGVRSKTISGVDTVAPLLKAKRTASIVSKEIKQHISLDGGKELSSTIASPSKISYERDKMGSSSTGKVLISAKQVISASSLSSISSPHSIKRNIIPSLKQNQGNPPRNYTVTTQSLSKELNTNIRTAVQFDAISNAVVEPCTALKTPTRDSCSTVECFRNQMEDDVYEDEDEDEDEDAISLFAESIISCYSVSGQALHNIRNSMQSKWPKFTDTDSNTERKLEKAKRISIGEQPKESFSGKKSRISFSYDQQPQVNFKEDQLSRRDFSDNQQPFKSSFITDQQPKSRFVADQQPKISFVADQQPKSNFVTAQQPKSSFVPVQQPKSSFVPAQQPKSSFVPVQQPKSSLVSGEQSKRNLMADQQPKGICIADQHPKSSFIDDQQLKRSLIVDQQPKRSFISDQQPEQSIMANQQPKSVLIVDQQPSQSIIADQQPRRSFGDGQTSERSIGDGQTSERSIGDGQTSERSFSDGPTSERGFSDDQSLSDNSPEIQSEDPNHPAISNEMNDSIVFQDLEIEKDLSEEGILVFDDDNEKVQEGYICERMGSPQSIMWESQSIMGFIGADLHPAPSEVRLEDRAIEPIKPIEGIERPRPPNQGLPLRHISSVMDFVQDTNETVHVILKGFCHQMLKNGFCKKDRCIFNHRVPPLDGFSTDVLSALISHLMRNGFNFALKHAVAHLVESCKASQEYVSVNIWNAILNILFDAGMDRITALENVLDHIDPDEISTIDPHFQSLLDHSNLFQSRIILNKICGLHYEFPLFMVEKSLILLNDSDSKLRCKLMASIINIITSSSPSIFSQIELNMMESCVAKLKSYGLIGEVLQMRNYISTYHTSSSSRVIPPCQKLAVPKCSTSRRNNDKRFIVSERAATEPNRDLRLLLDIKRSANNCSSQAALTTYSGSEKIQISHLESKLGEVVPQRTIPALPITSQSRNMIQSQKFAPQRVERPDNQFAVLNREARHSGPFLNAGLSPERNGTFKTPMAPMQRKHPRYVKSSTNLSAEGFKDLSKPKCRVLPERKMINPTNTQVLRKFESSAKEDTEGCTSIRLDAVVSQNNNDGDKEIVSRLSPLRDDSNQLTTRQYIPMRISNITRTQSPQGLSDNQLMSSDHNVPKYINPHDRTGLVPRITTNIRDRENPAFHKYVQSATKPRANESVCMNALRSDVAARFTQVSLDRESFRSRPEFPQRQTTAENRTSCWRTSPELEQSGRSPRLSDTECFVNTLPMPSRMSRSLPQNQWQTSPESRSPVLPSTMYPYLGSEMFQLREALFNQDMHGVAAKLIMSKDHNTMWSEYAEEVYNTFATEGQLAVTHFNQLLKITEPMVDLELKRLFASIGMSLIIHLTGNKMYSEAFNIYRIMSDWKINGVHSQVFMNEEYSECKNALSICLACIGGKQYDEAIHIVNGYKLLPTSSCELSTVPSDWVDRKTICTTLLGDLIANHSLKIAQKFFSELITAQQGIVKPIPACKFCNQLVLRLLESDLKDEAITFCSQVVKAYTYLERETFRAMVVVCVMAKSMLSFRMYRAGQDMDIYSKQWKSVPLNVKLFSYYAEEEIYVIIKYFLEQLIPKEEEMDLSIVVEICKLNPNTRDLLPSILKNVDCSFEAMMERIRTVLSSRLNPPLLAKCSPCERTIWINRESLVNYLKNVKRFCVD